MVNRNEYHRLYREKNKDKVLEIERASDKRNAETRALGRFKSIMKVFRMENPTDRDIERAEKSWSNLKKHLRDMRGEE